MPDGAGTYDAANDVSLVLVYAVILTSRSLGLQLQQRIQSQGEERS